MVRACRGLGLRSATWRGQPGWEAEVGSPGAGLVREAALTWKAAPRASEGRPQAGLTAPGRGHLGKAGTGLKRLGLTREQVVPAPGRGCGPD